MKVLILNHEYPPIGGGGGNACQHIVRHLTEMGLDITVVTSAFANLPAHDLQDGASVHRVPALRSREAESTLASILAYTISATLATRRVDRPDLVHAFFGVPSGLIAYGLKRVWSTPYLVSFRGKDVHGGQSREMGGITGCLKAVSMPVWRNADALVANSKGLREIAEHVDPTAQVEVIPNGGDTDRFRPELRRSVGPLRVLYVGRLEPYKGLETLLQAMTQANKIPNAFALRIVGDGSLRSDLERRSHALGLSDIVTFDGWVDRAYIPDCYNSADLFVMPSVVEGMPNGVLEAMASGLPVIASHVPGTEELIDSGHTGLLFESGDATGLADALIQCHSCPGLRKSLANGARAVSMSRSWERVAIEYTNIYTRLASRDTATISAPCSASTDPTVSPSSPSTSQPARSPGGK